MRRILLVGLLAVLAAGLLWVLSELEVSPGASPDPSPAVATTTPGQGTVPSTLLSDPALFVSAQFPGSDWTQDTAAGPGVSIWRNTTQSTLFAILPTNEQTPSSDEQ